MTVSETALCQLSDPPLTVGAVGAVTSAGRKVAIVPAQTVAGLAVMVSVSVDPLVGPMR